MLVVTINLKPTATYPVDGCRCFTFVRASRVGTPLIGVVEVQERRTLTSKVNKSRYVVREVQSGDGRTFQLTKPGGSERYYVNLSMGDHDRCTCDGFAAYNRCKHLECLQAMRATGVLTPLPCDLRGVAVVGDSNPGVE